MKQIHLMLKYSLVLGCVLAPDSVLGQIVPDATLRVNSSVTQSSNKFTINGGTVVGGNLFHSFQHFNVPTGTEAFFNNAPTIENILTRVTGGSISNIDGILRANGSANLFLLNPSGIIFGPNASLNIGGSFIGSSAMSIKFADGTYFSATNQEPAPLLTVNVPVGLQLGSNPGAIRVQGTGHGLRVNSTFSPTIGAGSSLTGLRVQPGKTLALVGGDVGLEGGILTARQGRIELGSGAAGVVSLSPTTSGWTLGYEGVQNFQNIRLSQKALVDASGLGDGNIQVQGRQVSVGDGSQILIQNQGVQPAGAILVKASESLELSGNSPDGRIASKLLNETVGVGNGGDIAVSTQGLLLQNGGSIETRSYSAAVAGNLAINASQSVQVIGFSPVNPNFSSGIFATTFGSGNAGKITLSTERLSVLGGGTVTASTFGSGFAGDTTVNATEVELIGFNQFTKQPSILAAATLNAGNAGSLTINTSKLAVLDGGIVNTSTLATGNAGSITVNASESVQVSGIVPGESLLPSTLSSSADIVNETVQKFLGLPPVPSGAAGNLTINTPALRVTDSGEVRVINQGSGDAGTLLVNARSIFLNNQGNLTAATAAGVGGNIFLQAQNLQMRRNSAISTTAGGTGNGGNITIHTGTLLALENSDITANAQLGFGGRVIINAKGIFGSHDRITASSALGPSFNGVVQFNTPDVDPSTAVVALPLTVLDPTHQITAGCSAQKSNNFVVTGRGGLPEDPTSTLRGATLWSDLRRVFGVGGVGEVGGVGGEISSSSPSSPSSPPTPSSSSSPDSPIVEATGWVVDASGQVELVAIAPNRTPTQPWQKITDCGN